MRQHHRAGLPWVQGMQGSQSFRFGRNGERQTEPVKCFFSILKSFNQFQEALVEKGEGEDGAKAKSEIQEWGKSRVRNPGEKKGPGQAAGFWKEGKTGKWGGPKKYRGKRGQWGPSQVHRSGERKGGGQVNNAKGVSEEPRKRGKGAVEGKLGNPVIKGDWKGKGGGGVPPQGGRWVCPTGGYQKKKHNWERR